MIPLWDEHAEKSALGSCFLSDKAAEIVFEIVKHGDFFSPPHAKLAEHLSRFVTKRIPIDLVTVRNSLRDAGDLEDTGGMDYIIQIAEFVPSSANAKTYAKIIKDKSSVRRLARFLKESDEVTHSESIPADEKLAKVEILLAEVAGYVISPDRQCVDISEAIMQVQAYVDNAMEPGQDSLAIPSKFRDIQSIVGGFEPGCVYTCGARSSMGKTSYYIDEAVQMAIEGHPVLFVSREMTPVKITMRFISKLSQVPIGMAKYGKMNGEQYQDWANASEDLYKIPLQFMTNTKATCAEIRREAKQMQRRYGKPPVIFDDYIQMALNGSRNMHMEISQMMTDYKTLAKELETPVLILSQLSRGVEGRDDKRPTLSDLKESGSIEENSDVVILLWRPEYYSARKEGRKEKPLSDAEFVIAKNREGGLGVATLDFRPAFTEFANK